MNIAFCSSVAIFSCSAVLLTQSAQALPARSTTSLVASQQQRTAVAAPIPSDLLKAKKIYLEDKSSSPDLYAQFASAMTAWGYYTLVASPAQADVVFDFEDRHEWGTRLAAGATAWSFSNFTSNIITSVFAPPPEAMNINGTTVQQPDLSDIPQ
jgi:hypothetical protein